MTQFRKLGVDTSLPPLDPARIGDHWRVIRWLFFRPERLRAYTTGGRSEELHAVGAWALAWLMVLPLLVALFGMRLVLPPGLLTPFLVAAVLLTAVLLAVLAGWNQPPARPVVTIVAVPLLIADMFLLGAAGLPYMLVVLPIVAASTAVYVLGGGTVELLINRQNKSFVPTEMRLAEDDLPVAHQATLEWFRTGVSVGAIIASIAPGVLTIFGVERFTYLDWTPGIMAVSVVWMLLMVVVLSKQVPHLLAVGIERSRAGFVLVYWGSVIALVVGLVVTAV